MCSHPYHNRGITLIELMVTIAVIAIVASIAIPSFQEISKRNLIASQNNELVALIHMARNEAIRRNPLGLGAASTVRLELIPGSGSWAGNVRPPGNTDPVDGCPVGAVRCSTGRGAHLSTENGNGPIDVRFDNRGYSVTLVSGAVQLAGEVTLQLVHIDCTSNRHARQITILPTGQVTSDPAGCPQ